MNVCLCKVMPYLETVKTCVYKIVHSTDHKWSFKVVFQNRVVFVYSWNYNELYVTGQNKWWSVQTDGH